jgi:hypothetical protein
MLWCSKVDDRVFCLSVTVSFLFLVHRCNALQLSQLCIATGQAVWVIYADLIFLSFDGNALDVALHALLAALESRMQTFVLGISSPKSCRNLSHFCFVCSIVMS